VEVQARLVQLERHGLTRGAHATMLRWQPRRLHERGNRAPFGTSIAVSFASRKLASADISHARTNPKAVCAISTRRVASRFQGHGLGTALLRGTVACPRTFEASRERSAGLPCSRSGQAPWWAFGGRSRATAESLPQLRSAPKLSLARLSSVIPRARGGTQAVEPEHGGRSPGV
jgi:hypothetical protein